MSKLTLSLQAQDISHATSLVRKLHQELFSTYPALAGGGEGARQPVHTVYGGAQIWKASTAVKLGELAVQNLMTYAPNGQALAAALGVQGDEALWAKIHDRVLQKLREEPIEDFRIDFEDGYGNRPDHEEDEHAHLAAKETAQGLAQGSLPPFIGIRIKPFTDELVQRSLRTLDIFVTTLVEESKSEKSKGQLPANFVVTLPKVMVKEQVSLLASLLSKLEERLGLMPGCIKMEFMVETTQAIFTGEGKLNILNFATAAAGRCRGAHFGTYDYTASCDIVARHQTMANPVCDFAKHTMQVALAGTGVWLSDGATNIMPVVPHRGSSLKPAEAKANQQAVAAAWQVAYHHIQHSLRTGYYQGWDLHPAQLVVRYAAVYQFFLENFASAAERLQNFIGKAAQATLVGEVFDDAATGQGLLNYFLRALNCKAITIAEAESTGLTLKEIRSRSFVKIIAGRQAK